MSTERGRDTTPLKSTGRGGAGNAVRASSIPPDEGIAGAERGRELHASAERVSNEEEGGESTVVAAGGKSKLPPGGDLSDQGGLRFAQRSWRILPPYAPYPFIPSPANTSGDPLGPWWSR
jgi:hypothetical protein